MSPGVKAVLPLLAALVVVIAWGVVVALRRRPKNEGMDSAADLALTAFVERSLDLGSLAEVLAAAAEAARLAFNATTVVGFEPGAREGAWDASQPGVASLEPVPDAAKGVFGWFKHNANVFPLGEISDARYGAMRVPLGDLGKRYKIDTMVPLVDRGQALGALGLALGRRPTRADRELLTVFRQQVTAAAANVRLHREAAHKLTMEKEVDLASALQVVLVPQSAEGRAGGLAWVGHYRPAGQVGSDFWSAYDLSGGRVLVVIGDVVGTGLAGSMASAVAKSCCDALHAAGAAGDVSSVLAALNRALFRHQRPIHMTCFAAIFDSERAQVTYANAGHELPYQMSRSGALGVLNGTGPMLGDSADGRYAAARRPMAAGDTFLLFTDGVSEAMNSQRASYGERRLQRALAAGAGRDLRAVLGGVLNSVDAFRGGADLHDDEALIVVRVGEGVMGARAGHG